MDKKHKIDSGDAIMVVPITSIPPQAGVLLDGMLTIDDNEKSKNKVIETIPENMHYLHTHTFEQRRQNWIIKNSSRRDGSTIDNVYKFLLYGEIPEKIKYQVAPIRKTCKHGNKLIKHYVVRTCESCNGVYIKDCTGVNYLSERDIHSNIEKKRKRENEDLFGHQQVNLGSDAFSAHVNSGDVTISSLVKSFFYLWDFELLP
ncbi:hypothetical protein R3W88_033163 [Solanum pinnatisectum]|uniref:Uncharacterized protein n=1 Tax=Solanum pinnatisectum TaxID=50273 RepID=A0AAV9K2F2_9SOLN|nr:hypothetical protein R3W88_033163 [Solanum pinnatisectum]